MGIPPLTAAMLRKKINSTMNLAHMGIGNYTSPSIHTSIHTLHETVRPYLGNEVAIALAPAIAKMPYLQVIHTVTLTNSYIDLFIHTNIHTVHTVTHASTTYTTYGYIHAIIPTTALGWQ
jgi:hypothetical protein